jgi:hypothetical protein
MVVGDCARGSHVPVAELLRLRAGVWVHTDTPQPFKRKRCRFLRGNSWTEGWGETDLLRRLNELPLPAPKSGPGAHGERVIVITGPGWS